MQIVFFGGNFHERSKSILRENKKNVINLSSAESEKVAYG